MKTYEAKVIKIEDNGDAILEIPDEILNELGWKEDDELDIVEEDGKIIMRKLENKMKMPADVDKFQKACDQNPSPENVRLYYDLITEEYHEFREAIEVQDEVEQLDACMDMIWVILGFCHMKGFDVEGAWKEVSKTNLNKIDPQTGKVNKDANGKVMKPEGWQPPNLSSFLGKE